MAVTNGIVFRVVNLVAAAFMIIGGVAFILQGGFPNFITAVYSILFGVITGLFEFKLPKAIIQFASFMFSLLGRGLFYIFLGCIILNYNSLSLACGVIIILIGVVYCICHFIPQIEPPVNMRSSTFEASFGMNQTQYNQESPYHQPSYSAPGNAQSPTSFHSNGPAESPYHQPSYSAPGNAQSPTSFHSNGPAESPYHQPSYSAPGNAQSPSSFHNNGPAMPPPLQQETTPYPQKTYIPNESHIP